MRSRFRKLRHDQKCKKMKLFQDMQLLKKLRDDQKRMKKDFENMSGSYEHKSNQDQDHSVYFGVVASRASLKCFRFRDIDLQIVARTRSIVKKSVLVFLEVADGSRSLWMLMSCLSSLQFTGVDKEVQMQRMIGDGIFCKGSRIIGVNKGRDCPKWNKKKSTGFVKKNAGQGSSMHSEGYDNGDLLMAVSEERFLEWIMDSGGSYHMTPRRDFLFDFKEFNGGTVLLSLVLKNVVTFPVLENLISLGTLDREGHTVKMQNGRVKVIKGSLMVLSGTIKENCVYSLDGWAESGEASVGIQEKESLAQVSLNSVKIMFWENQPGLVLVEVNTKQKELLDYRPAVSMGVLSRVDLMSGLSGNSYRLLMIIRGGFGFNLRHKNEAFSKFKEWKQLVENQGERNCLVLPGLRSGRSNRDRQHILINGIHSYQAWKERQPLDLWLGHPANYEMLRIFGCVAYSHVNQGKLKPRAIKCIFLWYPDGVKGYRLWRLDDVKPKIIISRDVVFNESLMYKDTLKGVGAADSRKEVEFEVELQGSRVEPTMDPHTRGNSGNEDEEQDEGPQQQNLDNYVLVRDRAKRTITIPARYRDEGNVSLSRPLGSRVRVTKEEMSSLKKNHTWELVDQPPGQKLISYKWLYKIKEGTEGIQKPRVILSLTACEDYELEQLDVKMAFLHGNLEETIYIRQSPGFEEGMGNKVCLLKKSLYGLKQSPRQWYKRFDVYMVSNGFSHNSYDSCVYFKEFAPGMYIYLMLYVDDMLIAYKSKSEIKYTKGMLIKEFDMKELGPARKILGMEIVRDRGSRTIKVSQSGYAQKILNNFRVDNGKSVSMPLGAHFKVSLKDCSLMYLMVCTRPDISYAVSIVSRSRENATLQHVVALSTIKAEYMALTKAVKESIWLKGLLIELEIIESKEIEVVKIGTDDNAADAFTKVVPGPKFKYCMEILGVGNN
ncbi:retrotransposon protein, putative, ty1-copia subclass [Tanacetum coccineum]